MNKNKKTQIQNILNNEVYTTYEVSKMLNRTRQQVLNYVRSNKLKYLCKKGDTIFFYIDDIVEFVKKKTTNNIDKKIVEKLF